MNNQKLRRVGVLLCAFIPLSIFSAQQASAIDIPADARAFGLDSLATVAVPEPTNLNLYVKNRQAAIALGKALFWDQQVGSDGQACASCHFHAGADSRVKNQLNPDLPRVIDPSSAANVDTTFGDVNALMASGAAAGAAAGANYTLTAGDFPFHQLADPLDRNSLVTFDSNDIASSQGTFAGSFASLAGKKDPVIDVCGGADGSIFHSGGVAVRKVEPRNTPTTINAVFNHRNFWDGRANMKDYEYILCETYSADNSKKSVALPTFQSLDSCLFCLPSFMPILPDTFFVSVDNVFGVFAGLLFKHSQNCAGVTIGSIHNPLGTRFIINTSCMAASPYRRHEPGLRDR